MRVDGILNQVLTVAIWCYTHLLLIVSKNEQYLQHVFDSFCSPAACSKYYQRFDCG